MFHSLTLCTSIAANRAISPEHRIHPVMSDLEDDELLLQVAGRSKPSARPSGKKRKRGSISISEDDDDDDDDDYSAEQEDGEMEDEPQIEAASRGKSSAEKSRKMQTSEKDPGVKTSCNRAHYLQQSDASAPLPTEPRAIWMSFGHQAIW